MSAVLSVLRLIHLFAHKPSMSYPIVTQCRYRISIHIQQPKFHYRPNYCEESASKYETYKRCFSSTESDRNTRK